MPCLPSATGVLTPQAQPPDGAMAHLNFSPAVLEVTNITPGAAFPLELQNQFDNTNGTLDVTVGTVNNFPSPITVVATVTFTALVERNGTIIQFNEAVTVIELGNREGSPLPLGALAALAMMMLAGAFIMRRRWQN